MITEVASYFTDGCGRCSRFATDACSARIWAEGVARLRQMCLDAGLEESLRWGHPCYRHNGRNLALIGAFQGDFVLTFPDAAILGDDAGLLEPAGPNSQTATTLRFASLQALEDRAEAVKALMIQARAHAEAGERPAPRASAALDLPDMLLSALNDDADLAEAFHALTPGRQRSYVIALSSAKTDATRAARIARFRDKILAGKGANER
ncbi:MAG: YdeI/OmpD-associated family protein [Rhodobacteraceae bacterium]|nr:YdeI/OmpD-associated family protein [Paracoccaceae bacterium]